MSETRLISSPDAWRVTMVTESTVREVCPNPRHDEIVVSPHGARNDPCPFERVHADAHSIGGEAIENRVGDDGMKPALTRHGSDTASQRFSGGEFPRAIGAGEHVLFDPVLLGPGQVARPVVDDVGESNRRRTTRVGHCFPAPPADLSAVALAKVDAFAQALERAVPRDTNDRASHPELLGNLG